MDTMFNSNLRRELRYPSCLPIFSFFHSSLSIQFYLSSYFFYSKKVVSQKLKTKTAQGHQEQIPTLHSEFQSILPGVMAEGTHSWYLKKCWMEGLDYYKAIMSTTRKLQILELKNLKKEITSVGDSGIDILPLLNHAPWSNQIFKRCRKSKETATNLSNFFKWTISS